MAGKIFTRIDNEILKCTSRLNLLRSHDESSSSIPPLIINTGDISDVDGFYALAKYAQSGADVLFIMNYPAYLNPTCFDECKESKLGLGFKYNTFAYLKKFSSELKKIPTLSERFKKYEALMNINPSNPDTDYVKRLFTDLGFVMASQVWNQTKCDVHIQKGKLFLCIGGINTINPFSDKMLKNELFVYVDFSERLNLDFYDHGCVYCLGDDYSNTRVSFDEVFNTRSEIYIDFNGSMAFYFGVLRQKIKEILRYVKGVFIMGGVFSFEAPQTMPRIKDNLNRFSCATMNQLYSPENTELFLADIFAHRNEIPVYVVTNNVVTDLNTFTDETKEKKTDDGWINFITNNGIHSEYLEKLASAYYNSHYKPPRKAFDFYTAFSLVERLNRRHLYGITSYMYNDDVYGVCMVSKKGNPWTSVVREYYGKIDTSPKREDPIFIKEKKENFAAEKLKVYDLEITKCRIVQSLFFNMTPEYKISMKMPDAE